MEKMYIEKGKNYKGLYVIDVYDKNRTYADGGNILLESRSFAKKSDMSKWLKSQK